MTVNTALPPGFSVLESFVAYWAAESLSMRDARRLDSTEDQRLAFYNAAKDVAPTALDYLDSKPFAAYDAADHRLLDLMLALIHVTLAVEVQRHEEHVHARGARQMPIVRERRDARTLATLAGAADFRK